jgi:alcohol dehydrogenase class IV
MIKNFGIEPFSLNEKLGLSTKLSEIGVLQEYIEPLTHLALEDFLHLSNPKPVRLGDFRKIN